MNKRGQFYIVAALLLIMILGSMVGVSTYAVVNQEPRTIKDISSDLSRESVKIIDYGIYNGQNIDDLVEDFAGRDMAEYFLKKTDDANIAFVYGNRTDINVLSYNSSNTGTVSVGGTSWVWQMSDIYSQTHVLVVDSRKNYVEVEMDIGGSVKKYPLEIKDNQMFYFVIAKTRGDEVFVHMSESPGTLGVNRPGGGAPFIPN